MYLSVAEARELPCLRYELTVYVRGPRDEPAKALLRLGDVNYVAVEQSTMQVSDELLAWTGPALRADRLPG